MKQTTLAAALSALLAPAWLAHAQPGSPGEPPPPVGSATAEVYHSVTGKPLAGMPVVVRRVVDPEGAPSVDVFVTDENGRAFLFPLEDGVYDAYVEYNTYQSNVERFIIMTDADFHPVVTLLFNPDIDRR